jgi:hypothetical protein
LKYILADTCSPRILEAAPTANTLPRVVNPNLDSDPILLEPLLAARALLPTFADAEFLEEQDFPASLGVLDPDHPVELQDITEWMSDVGLPYNLSDIDSLPSSLSSLPSLQHYEYAAGIADDDLAPTSEHTTPQSSVPSGPLDSGADGQVLVPGISPIRQIPRNAVPSNRHIEEERLRDPWPEQQRDISELCFCMTAIILHLRDTDEFSAKEMAMD